jgi:hypothetical protein
MSRKQNLYVGRAGQLAVMAEFLWRGLNVALPEVDIGEDVFVVKDETGELWRIQVKTATAYPQRGGYSAQFNVSLGQLRNPRTPDLIYIFATRSSAGWEPFIIIDRKILQVEHEDQSVGSVSGGQLVLRFSAQGSTLSCSGRDFYPFLSNWSRWPVIRH